MLMRGRGGVKVYMRARRTLAPQVAGVLSGDPAPRPHRACARRLPGSNLLFGLPVVMDTDNDAVREGDKVR